jgi:hypothetical protein
MKIGGEIAAHAAKLNCVTISAEISTDRCGGGLKASRDARTILWPPALGFTPSLAAAADLSFIADEQAFVIA